MLNQICLIGRIACDIEMKWTPSGIAVTTFRLAVDRPQSSEAREGGQEKQCDFIDCVAWRQTAEFLSKHMAKGCLMAVVGRMQVRVYEKDGQKRKAVEVVTNEVKALSWPPKDDPNAHPAAADAA